MVRSYQRHGPTQAFGLICSHSSNSVYDGKCAYVPALEDVLVWDVKKGQMLALWHESGHRAEVTCILRSPQKDLFAVGYADGSIRIWNVSSSSVVTTFNGHKKAVTALAFDERGTRLASGSQDTDLIVWDVLGESGLFRLRGHRDQITAIRFISNSGPNSPENSSSLHLLTTSKDTFMKLWDITTQHCIQTLVAHHAEIWCMDVDEERNIIFTGSGDGEMMVWKIDPVALGQGLVESENGEVIKVIHPVTLLPLSSRQRVSQILFHSSEPYVAVQSHERSVEIFRIRTEEEIQKKRARRKKRAKEKGEEKNEKVPEDAENGEAEQIQLIDLFNSYLVVRASGKIRSFDFGRDQPGSKGDTQLLMALSTNALETYNIPKPSKRTSEPPEAKRVFSVDLPGHRTEIRALSLSQDDMLLASASKGSLKLWNMKTGTCIRTMECGHAICSTFLPGDRHIAIGTKAGEILLYDVASSSLVETIQAHSGTIWSLHVRADQQSLVSGSADKDIKFWEFERKTVHGDNPPLGAGQLSLVHTRTLRMTDDILAAKYSPNGKLLAVALLDSTVKLFYQDSLKFFLALYGHKLPVLSMDISFDSKLIVTCSADKNVKIWGLDFGDCHKSIFAHEDSVMQIAFEPESHHFWTVSKDRMVKYWDADKFENIQRLDGHHGEIWALAVSHQGNFVVTGSHDKSIRVWEKLDEPLFLEEERERELENLYESGVADAFNRTDDGPAGRGGVDPANPAEAAAVTKQTTETLMAGERVVEALDLADAELAAMKEYETQKSLLPAADAAALRPPPQNPLLAAYECKPEEYVLKVIEGVQSTALHDALLVLPFDKVISLMGYLNIWAQLGWNIVLVSRIIFFLLKTHHHQMVANRVMRVALIPLRKHLRASLQMQKDTIGYNLAALHHLRRRHEAERTAQFFEEEEWDEERVRARIAEGMKRKRVQVVT